MRAVRFESYGDLDVLEVVEVPDPVPGPGEVLVRVKAAGISPGDTMIRRGLLHDRFPATFPSGQGGDLAGVVEQAGEGVDGWHAGDEVIGFASRASHAELVAVAAEHLTSRPAAVPWDVAGALFGAGATAWAAVRAVGASSGDVIVISGAAGGVGTVAVQLARNAGATVIGLASEPHHGWLRDHGAIPLTYGDGVAQRIRAAAGGRVDAFIDTYGSGYIDLALDDLGVAPERIDTIIDHRQAIARGVKHEGSEVGASAAVLAELAQLIADGKLEIPIANTYPLEQVRDAYGELEQRHTLGKIVLHP